MIVHDEIIQGSDEWYTIKLGKVSASHFPEAMAKGEGISRKKLMIKLIAERMTGETQETFSNKTMDRGIEVEDEAREYYELLSDCPVRQVGFVEHNEDIGVSPDGFVGENGLLEIKCPMSHTHLTYLLADKMPAVYRKQVQGQLWVTGRKWVDFVSFDPRVHQRPIFIDRIKRDEELIDEIETGVYAFVTEMKELMEKLTNSVPY